MKRTLFRRLCLGELRRFEALCRSSRQAQDQSRQRIESLLKRSPFWRERKFDLIESSGFTTYEDYRSVLEGALESPRSPLNGETIEYWVTSSGTSDRPKLFPLTASYIKEFRASSPAFMGSVFQRRPHFLKGKVAYLAGTRGQTLANGLGLGPISYFNYGRMPSFFRSLYAFELSILDSEERFFSGGARVALASDLSGFVAVTPQMIRVFFAAAIQQLRHEPEYVFRVPTLSNERRQWLAAIADRETLTMKDVWPNLDSIVCWKTSTCGLQLPGLLTDAGAGVEVLDAIYSASEGWMTVPLSTERNGGPLYPGSHVFEFLPVGASSEPSQLLKPWELEEGGEYEIVLTTSMGLVRYRLEDVVRCDGFFETSPWLQFVQKSAGFVSIGHSRISEALLAAGLRETGLALRGDMVFAPNRNGNGIMLHTNASSNVDESSLQALESYLRRHHPEYDADLRNGLMVGLELQTHADLRSRLGPIKAQSKPRLLLPNPL